jgi:hypothetical protein
LVVLQLRPRGEGDLCKEIPHEPPSGSRQGPGRPGTFPSLTGLPPLLTPRSPPTARGHPARRPATLRNARGRPDPAPRHDPTAAQRAIVVAKAMPHFEEAAKKRMSEGGKNKGKGRLPLPSRQSRDDAAKPFNVGDKSVRHAKALLAEAPDLAQRLEARTVSPAAGPRLDGRPRDDFWEIGVRFRVLAGNFVLDGRTVSSPERCAAPGSPARASRSAWGIGEESV